MIRLGHPRKWNAVGYTAVTSLFGGIGYGLIEVLWRGYTHPTMILTGGGCFFAICYVNRKFWRVPLAVRTALCTLVVVTAELLVGLLVNCVLHMNVWDYSGYALNLGGQVCLLYFIFWVFLSYPALLFCRMFRRWIFT